MPDKRTVLANPDRHAQETSTQAGILQEETEETEMIEVNKLVASSPPLCFPLFAPVPPIGLSQVNQFTGVQHHSAECLQRVVPKKLATVGHLT